MTITREELNRALCAIIVTLDEVDYAPASALYLGIGSDPEKWKEVKQFLEMADLATFEADNTVRLTPKGRDTASKINAANGTVPVKH